MSKRQFGLTVAAYLTGWLVAQSVFLRVWKYVMRDVYDEGYHDMARRMGKSLAEELEKHDGDAALAEEALAQVAVVEHDRRILEKRNRDLAARVTELETQLAAERRSVAVLKIELRQASR